MNPDPQPLEGRSLGRYSLLRVLGSGAMGVVYEGLDTRLGRTVAIKTVQRSLLLDDATAGDYTARFEREAQAAARLQHPNIVALFDFGEQGDVSYIVMEYIRGRELAQLLREGHVFTLAQIERLMTELLSALSAAHAHGIVHRDIKPANVLIDEAGQVKLADFGVARVVESLQDRTLPGTMVGTPTVMAPEQILGHAVGSRADLFAAGLIAYQLLTGQKAFDGQGPFAVQRAILNDEPVAPSTLNAALTAQVDAVLSKALSKSPDRRYASADEFARALSAALAPASAADNEATVAAPVRARTATASASAAAAAAAPRTAIDRAGDSRIGRPATARRWPWWAAGVAGSLVLALAMTLTWSLWPPAQLAQPLTPLVDATAPVPSRAVAVGAEPALSIVTPVISPAAVAAEPAPASAVALTPVTQPAPVRVPPAARATPAPRPVENKALPADPRCADLLTRIQLGDTLTPEQTTLFHTRCVR